MTTVLYGGAFASRHVLTGLDKSREEKERLADEDVAALVSQICSPFTIDEIYRYIRAGLFHHILSDLTHGTYSRSFQFTTVRLPYFCKNFNRLKTAESQQLDVHVQALLGFVGQIISDAKMDETSRLGRGWLDNGRSHEQMAMDIRNLLEAVLPIFDRSPSLLIAAAPTLVSILTLPPPPLRDAWGRVHSSDGLHTLTINMLYSCQPHALADACLHQLVDAAVASAKDPRHASAKARGRGAVQANRSLPADPVRRDAGQSAPLPSRRALTAQGRALPYKQAQVPGRAQHEPQRSRQGLLLASARSVCSAEDGATNGAKFDRV